MTHARSALLALALTALPGCYATIDDGPGQVTRELHARLTARDHPSCAARKARVGALVVLTPLALAGDVALFPVALAGEIIDEARRGRFLCVGRWWPL